LSDRNLPDPASGVIDAYRAECFETTTHLQPHPKQIFPEY
jgi:hypothetical protein